MLQKQRLYIYILKLNKLDTNPVTLTLRLKLCSKGLNKTKYVRYLGAKIDDPCT